MTEPQKPSVAGMAPRRLSVHQIAARLKQQHAGKAAILVDLSAIPAIHSRIMFRSIARFIEERTADEPIDAVPLARNILVMLTPVSAAPRLRSRLEALSAQLLEHQHGAIRLRVFNIDGQADSFAEMARNLMEQAPAPKSERLIPLRDDPPPDFESLTRIIDVHKILWQADLSSQRRRQVIWRLEQGLEPEAFAEETWVSIDALQRATGIALHDNIWLFGKTTELLDQRTIVELAAEAGSLDYPVSVNLHLFSLIGQPFRRFIDDKPAEEITRLIVEVPLVEWQLDGKPRETATALLREHGIRLCLDGIQPAAVAGLTDADWQDPDFLKFDAAGIVAKAQLEALSALPEARRDVLRLKGMLCHCEDNATIEAGLGLGIRYFQGRGLTPLLEDAATLDRLLGLGATAAVAPPVPKTEE